MKRIIVKESSIHGKGVFADEDIEKGKRIQYIQGVKVRAPKEGHDKDAMSNWYGVGRSVWIDPGNTQFRYLNHSCEPNAAVAGVKTLVALQDIKYGDEITIDYSMTDADPHWGLDCHCGAKTCRGYIRAIYTVPQEVFRRHMPHVPRYFQRAYIRTHVKAHRAAQNKR